VFIEASDLAITAHHCPSRTSIRAGCRGGYPQRFNPPAGTESFELRGYADPDPDTGRRGWVTRTVHGSRADALRELSG